MLKSEACKRGESVSFASNFSFQRLFSSGCTRVGLSEDCHPRLRSLVTTKQEQPSHLLPLLLLLPTTLIFAKHY